MPTNNDSTINAPKLGMNTDSHDLNMEKSQYSFALNASVENFDGNGLPQLQNMESNLLGVNFPVGFQVIGRKAIPELDRAIYTLVNPDTGDSEIAEVRNCHYNDDTEDTRTFVAGCDECANAYKEKTPLEQTTQTPYCSYRTITSADCLGFNINYPVDIEYRLTNTGVNIYFVDALNPNRFVYFDLDASLNLTLQDRFKVITGYDPDQCNIPIYGTALDCNKIKYNPDYSRPCVEFVDIVGGGALRAGSYQVMVAYADKLGNPLTKYFPATPHIPIRTRDITVETNYVTDRALNFKINNLEQSGVYLYYNIVIVETIDNFPEFKLIDTVPISQTQYTYTGNDKIFQSLTANDVFFERPIYQTAASITKANDYLFFARLKEHKKLNLQRAVNRMKAYWQTKAIAEKDLKNARNAEKFRSFMRDEVYPLALVFELIDDNDTVAFPLVGPSKSYFFDTYAVTVDSVISNNDVLDDPSCASLTRNKKWQVYNTGIVVGTPHEYTANCEDASCWEWGEFAYWESTRLYPNDPEVWGDLCGKPIRHFKFPDSTITHIHDSANGTKGFDDDNIVYPIGIKMDHTSVVAALNWAVSNNLITSEERARIKGYRVVRGNRAGNKSIVAKGLLYDMWKYNRVGDIYYPNYGYNDLHNDQFLAPDDTIYGTAKEQDPDGDQMAFVKSGRYTFHSPDTHFNQPTLGTELKLETEEYGKSEGFFNKCEEQPEYKLLSTVSYTLAYSFGIAAALSALEEKQCRTYTIKADYKTTEADTSTSSSVSGSTPVGIVTGSSPGAITTTVVGSGFTASGSGTIHHGDIKEEHNDPYANVNFHTFDIKSGTDDGVTGTSQAIAVDEYTATTCKGTPYQVLNSNSGIGGLGGLVGGIIIPGINETVNGVIFRTIIGLREAQIMLDLFEALIPKANLAIQYNSAGKYNNYKVVNTLGSKQRKLDAKEYLTPDHLNVAEGTSFVRVNNWHRETSVYLKTDAGKAFLPNPTVSDNSRVTMSSAGLAYKELNKRFNRDISSFYGSIKDFKPDQYGGIYDVEFLETNGCSVNITDTPDSCFTLFGGDTFISRFALKRKHPFFIQTRFRSLEGADVRYEDLGNAAYPNYYFNTKQPWLERLEDVDIGDIFSAFGSFMNKVLGTPKTRLDVKQTAFFHQKGYIYLYSYGIPNFLCESDVNVYYRHGENREDKDFYPHNRDLGTWLQEKTVPINIDNYYFYNKSYSRQNKESVIHTLKPGFKFNDEPSVTFNNRLVYTDQTRKLKENDSWLILRANNVWDTDISNGKIISVDGIENAKVLIRGENASQIFNAFDTLKTESGEVQIDKGGIFASRPQDFGITDLGFMGSQHRDIIKTEFGHVWTDAKRGQVFLLGMSASGMDELTKSGMRNWFRQNLPLQIAKDFPSLPQNLIDNNYKGIGIHLGFDKRFNRFFITKLDYKKKRSDITLVNNEFYIPGPEDGTVLIHLDDERYFEKRHWTISYNFLTKSWVSYHSFLPNYYTDFIDFFQTGINAHQSSLWSHNLTNKSYQVYYGKLYPFTISVGTEPSIDTSYIHSIDFMMDVLRYHNAENWFYNRHITFNKAVVDNERQSSGLIHLIPKDENDFSTVGIYPRLVRDGYEIETSNSQNVWSFNNFYDFVSSQYSNVPIWLRDPNQVDKKLNPLAFDYRKDEFNRARLRSRTYHVRLINDKWSNYKMIFFLTEFNKNKSIR